MKVADKIGSLKKRKTLLFYNLDVGMKFLGNMILEGESKGLSEEFVLKMFKAIHQESINHQEKIIKG